MIQSLNERKIMARPFWVPISMQAKFEECLQGKLDYSLDIWTKVLTLPCSTNIKDDELNHIKDELVKLL